MRVSGLVVPLVAWILAVSGSAALAQAAPAAKPPPLEVAVECEASPERVTIRNNRAKPVVVQRVGSTWQKRAGEPYRVNKKLKPGKKVIYTFGTGEGKGKRLSGSFIFDNDAPKEGAFVKTNKDTAKVRCGQGTNVPPPPVLPVEDAVEPIEDEIATPLNPLDLLATLPVEPEVEEGYERALFEHWVDADGDGCDTRKEVLIAESLTPVTLGTSCAIEDGTWYSPADGDTLTNPASVDINHVVPLKEAWVSGAHAWTPEQRRAFANDLDDERTLQAVSAGANRQQGENDPASWLPADREAACQFVTDWVAIKASWGLTVDEVERDAIEATLEACAEA